MAQKLRRWAPTAVAAITVLVLTALLAPRAIGGVEASAGARQLRLLTANMHRGSVPPEALVALVRRERVDLLAVQELTPQLTAGLARAGLGDLLPHQALAEGYRGGSGIFSRLPMRRLPPLEGAKYDMTSAAFDVTGAAPVRIISLHVRAPEYASDLPGWRGDLRALPAAPPGGLIQLLAGDFNATLDHRELRRLVDRGYRDAAEVTGAGLRGTWQGLGAPP